MVVQHPQAWPMIDEYGIDLHPGMYTAAAINEVMFCKFVDLKKKLTTKI